jgi:quercetin dioxygenase-like cupin family protein
MKHRRYLTIAAAAGALLLTGLATAARATPSEGFTSVILARATLGNEMPIEVENTGPAEALLGDNAFAPGGTSGWHSHPGPALIFVRSGTLTLYSAHDPSCTGRIYTAGQAFVDPGRGHVHIARNESGETPVEIYTVYLDVPVGGATRIDAADPGNCAF